MIDKQLIETLQNIKMHCIKTEWCIECQFLNGHTCQIMKLANTLNNIPSCWDMEKIERIINETN